MQKGIAIKQVCKQLDKLNFWKNKTTQHYQTTGRVALNHSVLVSVSGLTAAVFVFVSD